MWVVQVILAEMADAVLSTIMALFSANASHTSMAYSAETYYHQVIMPYNK